MLSVSWAVPTQAAVPRVRVAAIRALPKPHLGSAPSHDHRARGTQELRQVRPCRESAAAELDNAARGLDGDIDTAAARVRANADARSAFKTCAGNGLEGAGKSYLEALEEAALAGDATPAPGS
jgi:hypothetical protein